MTEKKPPRVFVSYSHDSEEHKLWVLKLATNLRLRGADVVLDMWDLKPGADIALFMNENLASADHILIVCTDKYVEKANRGVGGVGYEQMIINSNYLKDIRSDKVVPLIRQQGTFNLPTFLGTKFFVDFSVGQDLEFKIDELLRKFFDAPLYKKPDIGAAKFSSLENSVAAPQIDRHRYLMGIIAEILQQNQSADSTFQKSDLYSMSGMHKIACDRLILDLLMERRLTEIGAGFLKLTKKGEDYMFENEIVNLDIHH